MKHNRQNAYDDLAAVAADRVRRGVTTSKTLGVIGAASRQHGVGHALAGA